MRGVAAVAGFTVYQPEVDDDSIDLGLAARGRHGTLRSPRLELQVKGTGRDLLRDDGVRYPLKLKNYRDLRGSDLLVPRILVVVVVPSRIDAWLSQTEEELALRRCGYWLSLRRHQPKPNVASVTVVLPRQQLFSVAALRGMMESISHQEPP